MSAIRALAISACMALLAGCGSSASLLASRVDPSFTRRVERMLILAHGQLPRTQEDEAALLAAAFRSAARRCGIEATVVVRADQQLVAPRDQRPGEAPADTELTVLQIFNRVTGVTRYGVTRYTETGGLYEATLRDRVTGLEVWKAEFDTTYGRQRDRSVRLANLIPELVFARLATDRVLAQCPSGEAPATR